MRNNTVETLIGTIVMVVAVGFLFFAYSSTGRGAVSGYEITAKMAKVDGIAVGSDVQLSGLKVGMVAALTLNPNYMVTVHLRIRKDIQIPDDSSLIVTSSGLLGGSYLSISPGGDDKMLAEGGVIHNTQGSVDLMTLISRFIGGSSSGGSSSTPNPQPSTSASK
jgi:phospholipid/cholesterol/gamma-HCH transport system substrate-binding protein